jgi:hypothetical protein
MNRYGGTRFDVFVLIHRLSGVRTTAEAIDRSERLIKEPLRNALGDIKKNAPNILKQYAASPLSIVFLGFEEGTPVLAQIKFRSADGVEKHRCPGDCPNDFFAFFIGSDESKRQFEETWGFRTMPISVPGHANHRFRDDADHSFRDDSDQLIMIISMAIAMPRNVFHRTR